MSRSRLSAHAARRAPDWSTLSARGTARGTRGGLTGRSTRPQRRFGTVSWEPFLQWLASVLATVEGIAPLPREIEARLGATSTANKAIRSSSNDRTLGSQHFAPNSRSVPSPRFGVRLGGKQMRVRLLVMVIVAMTLVAACGSSGSSKTASSSGSKSSNSTQTSGGSSSGKSSTTVKFGGNGGSDFCDYARKVSAALQQQSSNTDPAARKKRLQASSDAIAHAASIAPSAIKADFDTFVSGLHSYLAALAAVNYDATKVDPTKLQVLTDPKFTTASEHINQYLAQVCKVSSTTSP